MTDRCCATCKHYLATTSVCRRYPPQVYVGYDREGGAIAHQRFPKASGEMLCGEWYVKEHPEDSSFEEDRKWLQEAEFPSR